LKDFEEVDISSTKVREEIKNNKIGYSNNIANEVLNYIQKNNLYI
jgi:nicotinic acid mononucleotide adenylyltransferase